MRSQLRKDIDNFANIISKMIEPPYEKDPVNSFQSAGIKIQYFVNKRYDAFLMWNYKKSYPIISINATDIKVRRIFSMAHELGHLVLNYNWLPLIGIVGSVDQSNDDVLSTKYRGGHYTPSQRRVETIVNEFAAAYLMPNRLMSQSVSINNESNYQTLVPELQKKFHVSKETASIRLYHYIKDNC